MKDLIEALNRAHQLDESSSEWFTKMKSWLKETGAEEEAFFWSDYHDYVDDIYGRAIEKVTEDYEHINVEFEFSTQAGRGMCQVFGNDDDGSGEYTWDFRDDRDAVFEFVNESTSVEELFNSLVDYLSGKVDCIQWEDNDDYDDEEDFDEALNRAHKLDEATTSVRVPAAIREYVDAYCDAINNMKGYNEDLWDRGTGGMFFMYSKPSSAYADRVMRAVGENYSLTKEQVKAVYEYVEFQEPADWYDDPSVKNEFVSLEINKSSEQFSTYKQYLSNLCRELKKKYQIVMFRKNNVGTAQQDSVTAVVECQRGSYVPLLTIKLDSAYGKKLEGQKLTSDVSKDADIISKLMLKHVNTNKAFWISYDEFIKQITSVVNSTRYMRLDETSTGRRVTIEYSDGREKNHNLSLNPDLVVIDPNVDNDVAGATVYFITPEKSSFNMGPYEFSASMWSKNKRESNYESSELNTAVQDIKSFLTSYDTPTAQWGRISQNESIKKLNTVDSKDTMEALNRAHELDEAADNREISISQNIEKILRYTQDHIDSFKNSSTNFDWLDDLTYRGVFAIPASCCDDYENVTDEEVEQYITKLLSNKKFVQQLNQYRAHQLDEAAFNGGMAGDNSASGGTIRGRGASTQPGKNNYLNRMKSKNPDLVDTMVIKVSDIKPGMITQAGQVKEAEARNHVSGGKKMYIMHTNGYDGFWGLDETMDVMVDPENKSKPFTGDYRALLKMGLQESSTSIDVFAEAKNRMPFVTSTSGTNENFEIVFEDDLTGDTFYIRGKLVDNRYNVQVEVHENRRSLWGYRTSVHFWNMNPLAPKSLCTLFDRWDRAYLASGQTSGHMRLGPVFKGWNASLRLSHDS